jgi:DNA-binding response OmpR family regulator
MDAAYDVLVVENDRDIATLIAEVLIDEGYSVRTSLSATQAQEAIAVQQPKLLLVDLHLPDKDGDLFVQHLRDDGLTNASIVIMSTDAVALKRVRREDIAYKLNKPFDLTELIGCVADHTLQRGA